MAKYMVTAPLVYAQRADRPSNGLGIPREVVRHAPGDIIELDEELAEKFSRKLEPYREPKREPRAPRQRKTKPEPEEPTNLAGREAARRFTFGVGGDEQRP